MPFALARQFNNFGQQGNEAGVCEAAVCLWIKRIKDQVGAFNWGSSAGDWVPTPENSNALYGQFDDGTYMATFQSYLQQHVYDPSKAHLADHNAADLIDPCCHYSGVINHNWANVIDDMSRGDVLFLQFTPTTNVVGHAMGVYRGSDYLFVFDPNEGLYRGKAWETTSCRRVTNHDVASAANYLRGKKANAGWGDVVYLGIHLRGTG